MPVSVSPDLKVTSVRKGVRVHILLSLFSPIFFSSWIATIQEKAPTSETVKKYYFDHSVTAYTVSVILQSILFLTNTSLLDSIFMIPLTNPSFQLTLTRGWP